MSVSLQGLQSLVRRNFNPKFKPLTGTDDVICIKDQDRGAHSNKPVRLFSSQLIQISFHTLHFQEQRYNFTLQTNFLEILSRFILLDVITCRTGSRDVQPTLASKPNKIPQHDGNVLPALVCQQTQKRDVDMFYPPFVVCDSCMVFNLLMLLLSGHYLPETPAY